MTNPDFLLESRCEITTALESIGIALGKAQDKKDYTEYAQNVQAHIDDAIRLLCEAKDLANRSLLEDE